MAGTRVLSLDQVKTEYPGVSIRALKLAYDARKIKGSKHGQRVWLDRESLELYLINEGSLPKAKGGEHAANA